METTQEVETPAECTDNLGFVGALSITTASCSPQGLCAEADTRAGQALLSCMSVSPVSELHFSPVGRSWGQYQLEEGL
jgi:hypothetical protein